MATINDLPAEILEEIFEYLPTYYSGILCSVALVCRHWRDAAQHTLFRNLEFNSDAIDDANAWLESPARTRFRPRRLCLWWDSNCADGYGRATLEACEGITSLRIGTLPYDLLLLPALSSVKSLTVERPHEIHPPPSAPFPPFHLSHLDLALSANVSLLLLSLLITPSRLTLTTLTLRHFGLSPSTATSFPLLFSTPSKFPALRHLLLSNSTSEAFLPLLPLLPHLTTLTLSSLRTIHTTVFTAIADAVASPSLAVLRVTDCQSLSPPGTLLDDLRLAIGYPGLASLRQLRLPTWFRAGVEGAWGEFEGECGRRGVGVFVEERRF